MSTIKGNLMRSITDQRRTREKGGLGVAPGLPSSNRPGVAFGVGSQRRLAWNKKEGWHLDAFSAGARAGVTVVGSLGRWRMFTGAASLTSAQVDELYTLMEQALASQPSDVFTSTNPDTGAGSGVENEPDLSNLTPNFDFSQRAKTVAQQLQKATQAQAAKTTMLSRKGLV